MLFTCRRQGPLPCSKYLLLGPNLECPLSLKDQIDFVLLAVNVALLFLSRLKAIYIAEESFRLKDVVLLHLLATKLVII
jgi:hypothetical protein